MDYKNRILAVLTAANLAISAAFAVPVGYTSSMLSSLNGKIIENSFVFQLALWSVIASASMAWFSYILPAKIRDKITITAFFCWILIAATFCSASNFYSSEVGYAFSILGALVFLFILAFRFHIKDILLLKIINLNEVQNENIEPNAYLLTRKMLASTFAVAISVSIISIPLIALFGNSYSGVIVPVTLMHISAFLIWLFFAVYGGIELKES